MLGLACLKFFKNWIVRCPHWGVIPVDVERRRHLGSFLAVAYYHLVTAAAAAAAAEAVAAAALVVVASSSSVRYNTRQ